MSFLEMVELLLNNIYTIGAGYWELLLECIQNILPYTFYDNINYARYLSAMLEDMLQLPKDFPEVCWMGRCLHQFKLDKEMLENLKSHLCRRFCT